MQSPQEVYTDEEVSLKTVSVYQHIYSNYYDAFIPIIMVLRIVFTVERLFSKN